ncbi:MAG: DUF2877 domain-containing protein [Albidovulum sp.]|nr:DUF2877 domain-containing protein [Albidovulum sp.]
MLRPEPVMLEATLVGPSVEYRLRGSVGRKGRVAAVLSSVAYVSMNAGLLSIARDDTDPCAFSVATTIPRHADFRSTGLAVDQAAYATIERIVVPGRLELDMRPARRWMPEVWAKFPDPALIRRGISGLRMSLPRNINYAGLGGFVKDGHCPEDGDTVGRAAQPLVFSAGKFVASLSSGTFGDCDWARKLIGLGPGLTPSGDDFLSGYLVALHAIGQRDGACRLWAAIEDCARASTNLISLAMLESAAAGLGNASLHAAVNAIISGECAADAIDRLSRFGNSSGWDALAGVVAVLESAAKHRRPLAA